MSERDIKLLKSINEHADAAFFFPQRRKSEIGKAQLPAPQGDNKTKTKTKQSKTKTDM